MDTFSSWPKNIGETHRFSAMVEALTKQNAKLNAQLSRAKRDNTTNYNV